MRFILTLLLFSFIDFIYCAKQPKKYNETLSSSRFSNPNFIRDRLRRSYGKKGDEKYECRKSKTEWKNRCKMIYEIVKPYWNESWHNRFKKPFHPAWMDYCDPYHCNDYNRPACGLNRKKMRFKWFQSGCHIILNNMCASYRGNLKYDIIETKYCSQYVLFLRTGCPVSCSDEEFDPVCGVSNVDNRVVVFRNRCALDAANCRHGIVQEYEEVDMGVCAYYL